MKEERELFKVGIIEDNKNYSEHLISVLSKNKRIGEIIHFKTAEECVENIITQFDLFIIDIVLPKSSGIEFLEKTHKINPSSKKIMLTVLESEEAIFQCLKLGCSGYALKTDIEKIKEIINITLDGGSYITPSIAVHVINFFRKIKKPSNFCTCETLTEKESQILKELSSGSSPAEIAKLLLVSVATIRFHIRGIYQKLEVNNRIQMLKKVEGNKCLNCPI